MAAAPPTEHELNEYHFILNIHKFLVSHLGTYLNGKDYSTHDNSKFDKIEAIAYTLKFVRLLPNDQNPGWTSALEHHYKNNNHHAQYWRYLNLPMPEEYIAEAVIDMLAARFQYQLNPNVVEDVRRNSYEIDSEKLLDILHKFMQSEAFFEFNSRFLEVYTDDEKEFIQSELKKHKENVMNC